MIDNVTGRVAYAVLSLGGYVGLGHSHYRIPWGALKYDTSRLVVFEPTSPSNS
ncbi:PRC-barrel domain-containing protein [Bradyrhizobium sp. LA6.10]|uniref:PRC-barrel domain-containing protein n=1 Tax=Bradyrhizobium sp. LA6.10 TaxID=3156318 RepID=UPI003390C1A1